jgi:hypothetical protein
MTNLLEQAINCNDGDRAAKIIREALGIQNAGVTSYWFPEKWPADREERARVVGEWLQMEVRLLADRRKGEMADAQSLRTRVADEHQPSCFGLEEERGENWKGAGAGAAVSSLREIKPTL